MSVSEGIERRCECEEGRGGGKGCSEGGEVGNWSEGGRGSEEETSEKVRNVSV